MIRPIIMEKSFYDRVGTCKRGRSHVVVLCPVGTGVLDVKLLWGTERRLLNRVLWCTTDGWELEPDQRHVDLIIKDLELGSANEVIILGEKDPKGKAVENEEESGPWPPNIGPLLPAPTIWQAIAQTSCTP